MMQKVVYSTEPEDFFYMDRNVPCQGACPAYTNIPAYIRAAFEENYSDSYEINRMVNIFPGILGRICSRPCEKKCRHGEPELGRPVNICHIKRAGADYRKENGTPPRPYFPPTGKKVAVIGSGPAGLAAAHDLAVVGISVTLFEAFDRPGGMFAYGIPEFRLPRRILREEINRILGMGVILKTGTKVGEDVSMEALLADYNAVLAATGCYKANPLNIPGEDLKGVYPGLRFMIDVCSGNSPVLGKRVLVVGAGFTAFDCARSALRLGAQEVSICLRRTEDDLTVTEDEVLETKVEGVRVNTLMLSRQVLGEEKVEGMEFVRTRPGALRPDGKREVTPIEGSRFTLPADTVIVATGQKPAPLAVPGEKNDKGILKVKKGSYQTSVPGLYLAGDYLTGPSTVIEAIAMGRWSAEQIAEDLTGVRYREKVIRLQDTEITDRKRAWDFIPRQEMPKVPSIRDRVKTPSLEVETGYPREQSCEESKRCYLCYLHYEIDMDRCIYCRYCVDVAPRDCIKLVDEVKINDLGAVTGLVETSSWSDVNAIVIDNERCIRCGECMRVCPVDCISVTRVERLERLLNRGEGDV